MSSISQAKPLGLIDYLAGVPEGLAQMLTGVPATVLAGYAGLADAPLYAAGLSRRSPADVVAATERALTYHPMTRGGQLTARAVSYPFRKYAQGAEAAGDLARRVAQALGASPAVSGAAGAGLDTAIQALPLMLGMAVPFRSTVNIGLNVGDRVGLTPEDALAALRNSGVRVKRSAVHQSSSEPTLIARTARPLRPGQADALSRALQQDAIAQSGIEGSGLYGPKAAEWGPFNPQFFLGLKGVPLKRAPAQPSFPLLLRSGRAIPLLSEQGAGR